MPSAVMCTLCSVHTYNYPALCTKCRRRLSAQRAYRDKRKATTRPTAWDYIREGGLVV